MRLTAILALVRREWKTAWNGPLGYSQRAFYAGLLLVGAVLAWGGLLLSGVRPSDLAEASRGVYRIFFIAQLVLATFLGAASFARALAREKERRTLDLLLLCPLSGFGILLGKSLGQLLEMLVVLAAGLPILVFLLPLGGMTLAEILSIHLILAGQLAAVGGVTAFLASVRAQPYRVMVGTWAVVYALMLVPISGRRFFPRLGALWSFLDGPNPLAHLGRELSSVWTDFGNSFAVLAGGAACLGVGCFLGGLLLERRHRLEQERRFEPGPLRRLLERVRASARAGWTAKVLVPVFPVRHPLTRRECALESDLRFRVAWLVFMAAFGSCAALVVLEGLLGGHDEEPHAVLLMATFGVVLVGLIVLAATSVTGDKRSGRFEAMLAANVEPEDLVRARLVGLLLRAFYLLAGPTAYALVVIPCFWQEWEVAWRLGLGIAGLAVLTATTLLLTVWIAIRCRGPAWAAALSLVFALPPAFFLGLWVAATPVTFAVGLPLAFALLLGVYAAVVRRFRAAALKP